MKPQIPLISTCVHGGQHFSTVRVTYPSCGLIIIFISAVLYLYVLFKLAKILPLIVSELFECLIRLLR